LHEKNSYSTQFLSFPQLLEFLFSVLKSKIKVFAWVSSQETAGINGGKILDTLKHNHKFKYDYNGICMREDDSAVSDRWKNYHNVGKLCMLHLYFGSIFIKW
jgi:hypothetical protein